MKIYAKAPLRLGLAGGGTDVSPYCDIFGGVVLNATISLFARVIIRTTSDNVIVTELVDSGQHFIYPPRLPLPETNPDRLITGVYNYLARRLELERPPTGIITSWVEVPPGSGLGSSSTLTVALVGAISRLFRLPLGKYDIANIAYEIERNYLGFAGGRQDQYAAAFGGFNFCEFGPGERVVINPLGLPPTTINALETHLILFNLGTSRLSSAIIQEQIENVKKEQKKPLEAMHFLKDQAIRLKEALLQGKIEVVGDLLYEGWLYKKQMAKSISNPYIEEVIEAALKAGARGAKISGAGGGGFLLLFVDIDQRYQVMKILKNFKGEIVNFCFIDKGLEVWEE